MDRALPRPLVIPWRALAWVLINGFGIAAALMLLHMADWPAWETASRDLWTGELYETDDYVWSPIAAWLLAGVVALGWPFLVVAHFVAIAFLPSRLLVATSFPFWVDMFTGNFFTFVAVSGYWALRGNRPAAIAFLATCALMPRPVQVPLALWLLWKDRSLIWWAAGMAGVTLAVLLVSGYTVPWAEALLGVGAEWPSRDWDLGPTRFIGTAWLVVGVPLAVWLGLKGRVGWAGLAMSPYLAPQYFMALLWSDHDVEAADAHPRIGAAAAEQAHDVDAGESRRVGAGGRRPV